MHPEAEFLDVIGTKVFRVFLPAFHRHLYYGFYSWGEKGGLKLVCNVNIVYGNFRSENSQNMPRNLKEIGRSRIMYIGSWMGKSVK